MSGIDDNTLMLLHFEDLQDSSKYNVRLTNVGALVTGDNSKFGGKSAYFNGSTRVDLPQNFTFDFSSNEFTVDWWQFQDVSLNGGDIFWFSSSSNQSFPKDFGIYIINGYHTLYYDSISAVNIASQKLNAWIHYAFVKKGSNIYYFENGKKIYTASNSSQIPNPTSYKMSVGGRSDYSQYFHGYIDEFRVSNVARWTENFEPPTEPYSTGSGIYVKINGEWKRI